MRVSALGVVLALLVGSGSAFGFCRTTTCGSGECATDPSCQYCLVGGKPLYWPGGCVSFSVQKYGSRRLEISAETAREHVRDGLSAWVNADCGWGAKPSIITYDFRYVSCAEQEYNKEDGNANIWMFRDRNWPYMSAGSTLALTTITFDVDSGEIFDADVELNSFENRLTTTEESPEADLLSIVTHEAGHFLGLSHSCENGATMEPHYRFGDTSLRDLAPDDVAGICTAYPANKATDSCDPEPRNGYSTECGADPEPGCCTTAPGAPADHAPWAIVVSLLGGSLLAARRRARAGMQSPRDGHPPT